MILQKVFDLETFTHSDTAKAKKIDNTQMTNEQLESLTKLHLLLIEIRDRLSTKYSKPINIEISSGFRSVELNKAVKGSATSQHCKGEAVDTIALSLTIDQYFNDLKELANKGTIKFGQVIKEQVNGKQWVHISLPREAKKNNNFMATKDGINYESIPLA